MDERPRLLKHLYAIGLGSNQRHHRHGSPRRVIAAAFRHLPGALVAQSLIGTSRPIGPSQREYANAAALVMSKHSPPDFLRRLKAVEHHFGRRRGGRRWSARVLDLDILLWTGGMWSSPGVIVPHPQMRLRRFVLRPLEEIAADWCDPLTGLTVRHLRARLDRPRPHD